MKTRALFFAMLTALSLCLYIPLHILSYDHTEDEILRKVVLFKQVTQYITWPETSGINDKSKPFVIGVAGKKPFGGLLQRVYSNQTIRNKKVRIITITTTESIRQCHMLFVAESAAKDLPRIIAVTKDKPILTMGEKPGFAEKGILLNLYYSEGKIRFEINGSVLQKSSLTIDPLLLRVSRIVTLPEPGK